MCFFSFGRLAQSWLPEQVHVQVKRQDRLIWLENVDRKKPAWAFDRRNHSRPTIPGPTSSYLL
jgi:hypothetical protein